MTRQRPLVVVVTGSECTGKTTLVQELAARSGAPCSTEYAREYLAAKAAPLVGDDVEAIARGQAEAEDAAVRAASGLVFKDTDLVSTVVYAHHYYGACPAWVEREAEARLADLYLLLHPDVPWVADGLFRDRPSDRALMHGLFSERLASLRARVVDVSGAWDERRALALRAVAALLDKTSQIRR